MADHRPIIELHADPSSGLVYEHGWQSWSPAGAYRPNATSPRPARPLWQTMGFRPETPAPATGFQAEGLLAVHPGPGAEVVVLAAPDPHREVPSIRAEFVDGRLVVTADGEVATTRYPGPLPAALASHAQAVADRLDVPTPRPVGTGWCSWYGYYLDVTEQDVLDNVAAADRLGLRVDTIQLADGYQTGIGDWLTRRTYRFPTPLTDLGGRAADSPNLILAGVMIAIAVPVTVFVLAQRYFVENVASSGIK